MKENKNIERLFQEKFKDFEVSPPDFVWENIQEKLNTKENKRRVIPFWFKTAGIAASFVAIISVVFYNLNDFGNNSNFIQKNSVVNSDSNNGNTRSNSNNGNHKFNTSNSNKDSNKNNKFSTSPFQNGAENNSGFNSVVQTNATNTDSKSNATHKSNKNTLQNSNGYKSNSGIVSNSKDKTNPNSNKHNSNNGLVSTAKFKSNPNSNTHNSNNGLVTNHKTKTKQNSYKQNKTVISSSTGIAFTKNNKNKSKNNGIKSNSKFNDFNTSINQSSNSGLTNLNTNSDLNTIQKNSSNSDLIDINKLNASNPTSNGNTGVLAENNLGNSNNNTTAIVAVEEIKIDTIALATVIIEENIMEKLLREKETKKVVDEKEKWSKWAVNSYVSPVFFNSFTDGSPISDEFASNEKTFKNSTSYGIGIAYNLNKRFVVKTGVSNLNLDYDTENIAFYSSYEDQSRISNTNIERNSNGKYLVLKHEKDRSKIIAENELFQSGQTLGNLNQKTQYIEVPLELSYAVLNKKFGVAIKGGMSTLFLTENVVSITSEDGNMQIGKASNLNNVHFSSNIGLGLSYSFMKNLQLNLEPTLKYQINTFNKNSNDFSPYVIGVNTGISYKF